jgi:hypothetical protein
VLVFDTLYENKAVQKSFFALNLHHGRSEGITFVEGVNGKKAAHFDGMDDYVEE